jgi:thymidylate synthase
MLAYYANNNVVEHVYLLNLHVINTMGEWQSDRTSVGRSKQMFGLTTRFHTQNKYAPFIQCRSFAPRIAFEELMWMLRGSTDVTELQEKNIHIWDGNSTREFLDSRGMLDTPENNIGRAYGYQFRSFGGVTDQVKEVFEGLRDNPTSRRYVISIWNPNDKNDMALEPCFYAYNFVYINGVLNLDVTSRSNDYPYGAPYNLAFSFFWLLLFSRALGYKMGNIRLNVANAHYYENQQPIVDELLDYHCRGAAAYLNEPICDVKEDKEIKTLQDVLSTQWSDIVVSNCVKGPTLGAENIKMAV